MKFLRFRTDLAEKKGIIEKGKIRRIIGNIFTDFTVTDEFYEFEEIHYLPPVIPSKIICVGRNYAEHASELNNLLPENPLIFLKPPSAIIANEETILYPEQSHQVDYEGELAVVIGKRCKNIAEKNALDAIFGFTCFNDVTARDIQKLEKSFTRAKSFDTFAPVGPIIETEIDLENTPIKTYINGNLKQNSNINKMIFKIPYLISFISSIMTLYPGDIIATGTPEGVGALKKGDITEITIHNIGTLKNYVG